LQANSAITIVQDGFTLAPQLIGASKRIGVESAGEAANYPYRFYIKGNKYVSGSPVR
jgi:DNA-3-methyladenine glycosylase